MEAVRDREDTWLSISQAAAVIGVNPRTVRRYIKAGRLPVSRVTTQVVRIRLADIERFMQKGIKPVDKAVDKPVDKRPKPAPPPHFTR